MDLPHPDPARRKREIEEAIRARPRAVLVVNSRSRRGRRLHRDAERLLAGRGIALAASYAVRDPARLPEIVKRAVGEGHPLVIVGGGDGTVSSVADHFEHRDTVLGILPLGTANSFARTLGIPVDLEGAVEVIATGRVADVDLGRIGETCFANAAAIGLPATLAREMPRRLKKWLGRAGYLVYAVAQLARHRPFRCRLAAGGEVRSLEALELRVANGQHQGGVRVAADASVESRDLVVQCIVGRSRWALPRFWARALLGLEPATEEVEVFRGAAIDIDTDPPQYVSIDGEPVTRTPIRATVSRQSLLLVVPRERRDLR